MACTILLALAFLLRSRAEVEDCYTNCNLTITPLLPENLNMQCAQQTLPDNVQLLFISQMYPWQPGNLSHIVSLRGNGVTSTTVQLRGWQLQVINSTTVGALMTNDDTGTDYLHRNTYMFYNVYTGLQTHVNLPFATHDARYNRKTNTIFFLQMHNRMFRRPCPPYDYHVPWHLETLVEVNLQGHVVWRMEAEHVLCHKDLTQHPQWRKRSPDPFHLNTITYYHAQDLIILTSQMQSTIYAVQRRARKLAWAIGAHGSIPLVRNGYEYRLSEVHHFVPIGSYRFLAFHNNYGQTSELLVVHLRRSLRAADVEIVDHGPGPQSFRGWGGAVVPRTGGLLGGVFKSPPNQLLSPTWPQQRMAVQCTLRESFIYGASLVYSDFNLQCQGNVLHFHGAFHDVEPVGGRLTVCYARRGCRTSSVVFPPFLQTWAQIVNFAGAAWMEITLSSDDGFEATKRFTTCG